MLRREADRQRGGYVDVPRRLDVVLVLVIMALSLADALLTLDHIERGGIEWNPAMRLLLDHGTGWFVSGKMAVTGVGMVFLLAHMHFRRTRILVVAVLGLYLALTAYHVSLLDEGVRQSEDAASANAALTRLDEDEHK